MSDGPPDGVLDQWRQGWPAAAPAARSELRTALDEVDDALVDAALRTARLMPRVRRCLHVPDAAVVEEADRLAAQISSTCRAVEDRGFLLLAREAPVGGDLRRLVAILRLVLAVERSGALLRHAAETVAGLDPAGLPDDLRELLDRLATASADVFRQGIDAWRQRDGLAVHEVDHADRDVDGLRQRLLVRAAQLASAADTMALGLLGRYYERIADHGVAFARDGAFVVTGLRLEAAR